MKRTGDTLNLDFSVSAFRNGKEIQTTFKELLTRPSIVSVYMKNNTPSCNKQNVSLAEDAPWFYENGFNVIALSKDGIRSHERYAKKMRIGYTLVSDPENKFSAEADSIIEKSIFGKKYKGPSRSAFVIDTDGTILGVIDKIDTKNHAEELKELVHGLK